MNSSPSAMSEFATGAPSRNNRAGRRASLSAPVRAALQSALTDWLRPLPEVVPGAVPSVQSRGLEPGSAKPHRSEPGDAPLNRSGSDRLKPKPSPKLWIAFSGGLDSSVLLNACAWLAGPGVDLDGAEAVDGGPSGSVHAPFGHGQIDDAVKSLPARFELRAVHVAHGLQPESDTWAGHCHSQCDALGIPLEIRRLRLRVERAQSLEAVAREARYAVFRELLGPGDALMTAQHRNDQAESLLLALLRGSGPAGLAGMGARQRLGTGWLLRPFLTLPRSALEAEAERLELDWVEDPSNTCLERERNRLRHQVLPLLAQPARMPLQDSGSNEINEPEEPGRHAGSRSGSDPSLMLARSAAHCAEAQLLLDDLADALIAGLNGRRPQTLSISGLLALRQWGESRSQASRSGPPRLRLVLRRWIQRCGFLMPGESVLERIIGELLQAGPDRNPLVAWRGCEARRYRDDFYLMPPLPNPPKTSLHWDGRQPLKLPESLGRLQMRALCNAAPAIEGDILFATQARGLGPLQTGQGFHRSLKHCFQEAGIPAWLRPQVPVLVRDREILAIPGLFWHPRLAAGTLHWRDHPWVEFGLFVPSGD